MQVSVVPGAVVVLNSTEVVEYSDEYEVLGSSEDSVKSV